MDDVYRNRQDPAVTVGLRLSAPGSSLDGGLGLVGTTTPWTVPSNLGIAVHPNLPYVTVQAGSERYLIAEDRVLAYARELGDQPQVVGQYLGLGLLGLGYTPPFYLFAGRAG